MLRQMAVGLRIGRYELGERLGTGGFGVVYHARDTELGRELAIKVLRPEYQTQPDVLARFLKEARAAAKIDHPGIVTVFECGTISDSGTAQDGNAYIAMELLRGLSLTQHLEKKGRMSPGDAILIAHQVCGALAVAHASGIVHRDLKPDNLFLLPDPLVKGGFRIKILDFGVAKLLEPKEVGVNTHSQMMLGTPKYMSPEQARSARAVDQRTDIYTLGCMLYEMVTGQAPYEGPGAIDMIIQHTTAPIPSAAAIVHGLPASLDRLITQMMAKEADERPATMLAIDEALAAIEALPPPIPARAKPPTAPPAIPRPPARPTPVPTGLTPTPVVETMRPARLSAPVLGRPSPMPSSPFASSWSSTPSTVDEEAPTASEPRFSRPTAASQVSRAPLFAAVGIGAAIVAALVVWFVFPRSTKRSDRQETVATQPDRAESGKGPGALSSAEITHLKQDCLDYEKTLFWKELKECADRLKSYDRELGEKLWTKADDEAANEKKWKGVQKYVEAKELGRARDLVKRIGDGSVYTDRAHKLLDEAEATNSPASP
jgi:serine/threonine protein kinase